MKFRKIDKVMMETARNFSSLSYCKRKQVGAVLSLNNRIIAVGYNGTIKGTANCCEDEIGNTNEFVLHAEQNVFTFCNREGLSTNNCDLYITMSPCKTCSKLIASAGIKRVFYSEEYRDLSGVEFLTELGIEVNKI